MADRVGGLVAVGQTIDKLSVGMKPTREVVKRSGWV